MRIGIKTEREIRQQGFKTIAGCDEAGRGPLAGPVVCASVILPVKFTPNGIIDSKLLSEDKREELYSYIVSKALAYQIVSVDRNVIDQINILQASLLGMRLAVEHLTIVPEFVLVDGKQSIPDLTLPQKAVIQGDRKSLAIAAASILAKVTRDRIMRRMDRIYPQYKFAQHKGYPTRAHKEAIMKFGPSEYHRRSFKFIGQAHGIQEQIVFD